MLKRICVAGIVLLMLTCIQFVAVASNDNLAPLLDKVQLNVAPEKDEIQKAINESKVKEVLLQNKQQFNNADLNKVTNEADLIYGTPYKVVVANEALTNALLEGKNLAEVVAAAPYFWEVPVLVKTNSSKAIASFIIDKFQDKWQVAEIGPFLSGEDVVFSSDSNTIKAVLQKNELGKADSLAHVRIPAVHQDYLYLSGADQEYFIPVNQVRAGAKSSSSQGKVKQTRDEVLNLIGEQLKQNKDNTDPVNSIGGGGISEPKTNSPIIPGLIVGLSAIALLGWVVLRKRVLN